MSPLLCNLPDPDPGVPLQMVLLRHTLPDGDGHLDWLIAREAVGGTLASLRLSHWPQSEGPDASVEITGDHDRTWLDRQGEVSGGRGEAIRIDQGALHTCRAVPSGFELEVRWVGAGSQSLLLSSSDGVASLACLRVR